MEAFPRGSDVDGSQHGVFTKAVRTRNGRQYVSPALCRLIVPRVVNQPGHDIDHCCFVVSYLEVRRVLRCIPLSLRPRSSTDGDEQVTYA